MAMWQNWLAWYLKVPAPSPGEGIGWKLTTAWPFPARIPEWICVAVCLLLVLALNAVYHRDGRELGTVRRGVLKGLRLAAWCLGLFALTGLSLTVQRVGWPVLAVMLDTSASMGLIDSGANAVPADGSLTRLTRVQQLLTRDDAAWLRELSRRFQLQVYRFDEQLVELSSATGEKDVANVVTNLAELVPDGESTRPAVALRQLLEDLRGAPLAGVVILTDGVASHAAADRLSQAADAAGRRGVALYPVGVGESLGQLDLILAETQVQDFAFAGDPLIVQTRVRCLGSEARTVQVQLLREGQAEPLVERTVAVAGNGSSVPVELSWTPAEPGELDLIVAVVPAENELNRDNNRELRHVSVRSGRIRTLLADTSPRYEFRYLKHLLERENSIELKTILFEADAGFVNEDRTALQNLPVRKDELFQYDVIVLGDLNPGLISPAMWQQLTEFVQQRGGGLVLISGPRFNPVAYAGLAASDLFPFDPAAAEWPASGSAASEAFQPHLTIEGQKGHPLFRLAETDAQSAAVWNTLPGWYSRVEIRQLKPGALVLAEQKPRGLGEPAWPLIVLQRAGAGKVLFHASDETWRWRYRAGDKYFGAYWVQAIRYLSRGRLIGTDRRAELYTDRQFYDRGQPVTLRVRFLDERAIPADGSPVTVELDGANSARQSLQLTPVPQAPSLFEVTLQSLSEDSYHGFISRPTFQEAPPSTDFRVVSSQRELAQPQLDRSDLEMSAKLSGGRYFPWSEAANLPRSLPAADNVLMQDERQLPLWNRPEVLALLAAVLTIEWSLRKRWKLA